MIAILSSWLADARRVDLSDRACRSSF